MSPRARRLVRGWTASLIATGLGAGSHSAVDGHWPATILVVLAAALAAPVCILVAGRILSRAAVLVSVLVSQGLLHWLFAQAGHGVTASDHTHHGAASGNEPQLVISSVPGVQDHGGEMLLAHVIAAVATYGLLRHGEVAFFRLLGTLSVRALRIVGTVLPRVDSPVRHRICWTSPRALADQLLLPVVHGYRGPPALTVGASGR